MFVRSGGGNRQRAEVCALNSNNRTGAPGEQLGLIRKEAWSLALRLCSASLHDTRNDWNVSFLGLFLRLISGLMKKYLFARLFLAIILNIPAENYKIKTPKGRLPAS